MATWRKRKDQAVAAQGQALKKWRQPPPPQGRAGIGGGGKTQAVAVDLDRKDKV